MLTLASRADGYDELQTQQLLRNQLFARRVTAYQNYSSRWFDEIGHNSEQEMDSPPDE